MCTNIQSRSVSWYEESLSLVSRYEMGLCGGTSVSVSRYKEQTVVSRYKVRVFKDGVMDTFVSRYEVRLS